MATTVFTELPSELLEAIFLNLDPHSLISVSQTSKLFKQLTADSPLLWRHLCQTQFRTWDSHHNIATKLAGPLSGVDWRGQESC
jgi:F-box protein 21